MVKKPTPKKSALKTGLTPMPKFTPKPTIEFFDDIEQGSAEWFAVRAGIPTASNFSKVMAQGEGKTRLRYMRELAGEILTGRPTEGFKSKAMDRGNEMEAKLREQYGRENFVKVRQVGFVKNSGIMKYAVAGASPDGLIDPEGGLEIKSMEPNGLIDMLDRGASMPPEHRAQVQGNMWVCERKWWDFRLGYTGLEGFPGMPTYRVRVIRDDHYIEKELRPAVETFCYELKKMIERLKAMGV